MDGAFANPIHWIFAILIIVLVFGANKLGDVGGALGRSVREFKKATQDDDADAAPETPEPDPPATIPAAFLGPPPVQFQDYRPSVSEYRPAPATNAGTPTTIDHRTA